jgi:hypothetical protein
MFTRCEELIRETDINQSPVPTHLSRSPVLGRAAEATRRLRLSSVGHEVASRYAPGVPTSHQREQTGPPCHGREHSGPLVPISLAFLVRCPPDLPSCPLASGHHRIMGSTLERALVMMVLRDGSMVGLDTLRTTTVAFLSGCKQPRGHLSMFCWVRYAVV